MGSNEETIPLGLYLWKRIKEIGISNILGCPGDFNLTLLDYVYAVDGLDWVGSTNELNAAYSADGYARVKQGAGCLVTTHGVGELSALNGVAGAMTEQIKVIHIVGQTSRKMQENRMMIHHSIGFEPDHHVFSNASRGFRCAAAELQSEVGAPEEIDRVLRECFIQSKPVYIFLPIDLVDVHVPARRLLKPIDLQPTRNEAEVKAAAEASLQALYSARSPCVFVDCLVQRHGAVAELKELVEKLAIPVYCSNMGKGIIDETHKYFVQLYNGAPSGPGVHTAFSSCDVILMLGNLPSDTNTGGFTRQVVEAKGIFVDPYETRVLGQKRFTATPIKHVLQSMNQHFDQAKMPKVEIPQMPPRIVEDDLDSKMITQSYIWPRIARFLQPNDVVYGETGTAAFGMPDVTFPPSIHWITQTYYGSIGYATASSCGADLALEELASSSKDQGKPRGRTVLLTGDGSLMLTVQEIGNMVNLKLKPIIFVINNDGYTIERVIHGAHQSYNDIPPFNYRHMLPFFGMDEALAKKSFHRAGTKVELEEILAKETVIQPANIQVIEVVMDKLDVPWRLSSQIASRGPDAMREMTEAGFKFRELEDTGTGFWDAS
ncbi:pyruvate decarboxylase-like protein [Polychaeton citri CBS 116435]|uniref:Pyruvate decarboxylase n=1 Tax=Polychaeton citri CBS 116435 TaxID=1314669 RepID=A0A9P4UKH5_9PEZI|nr:pyruvate decarboxylase-like protein [Polychaeton citri CBS 116435]